MLKAANRIQKAEVQLLTHMLPLRIGRERHHPRRRDGLRVGKGGRHGTDPIMNKHGTKTVGGRVHTPKVGPVTTLKETAKENDFSTATGTRV